MPCCRQREWHAVNVDECKITTQKLQRLFSKMRQVLCSNDSPTMPMLHHTQTYKTACRRTDVNSTQGVYGLINCDCGTARHIITRYRIMYSRRRRRSCSEHGILLYTSTWTTAPHPTGVGEYIYCRVDRGTQCICSPPRSCSVRFPISAARTPSVPPICSSQHTSNLRRVCQTAPIAQGPGCWPSHRHASEFSIVARWRPCQQGGR